MLRTCIHNEDAQNTAEIGRVAQTCGLVLTMLYIISVLSNADIYAVVDCGTTEAA